jgi:inner membrane protease subunit 1
MLPTISHSGDWVLVSPLPYSPLFRPHIPPKRGDLVFAISPTDPGATVCKRVIGVEGDVIEVEVRRNVNEEIHRMVGVEMIVGRKKGEGEWVKVPKGMVWLAGDNMSNSTDSRVYGPVPLGMIKGQVLARVSGKGDEGYSKPQLIVL